MTESLETAGHSPGRTSRAGLVRRVLYPAAVIALIAGVIWYLDSRDDAPLSSTGERFGPVDLPSALVPQGARVSAEEGALAPDFLLQSLDGPESRLSDYRGRPVVLNFWATWCIPCRQEMPQLVNAYDDYRDSGLVIIALNLQESESIIRPFTEDFGVKFPVLIDRDGEVGDRYRLLGLPVTYFIDADGVIRGIFTGPFERSERGTNVQGAIASSELERRINEIVSAPGDDSAEQ